MAKISSLYHHNPQTIRSPGLLHSKIVQVIPAIASLFVISTGCLILIGWQFDLDWLKHGFVAKEATMKANAALGFILAGISLGLVGKAEGFSEGKRQKRVRNSEVASECKTALKTAKGKKEGREQEEANSLHLPLTASSPLSLLSQLCAIAVFLTGFLTFCQYIFGWNLGIDELLYRDSSPVSSQNGYPGRMGDNSALNFCLLGLALWLHHQPFPSKDKLVQGSTVIAGAIAALALLGHLYGVDTFHGFFVYSTSMAWHTAFTFIVLCGGVLFVSPDRGLMEPLTSDFMGSKSARQLLPGAMLIPTVLGWLILQGQKLGIYQPAFSFALLVMSLTIIYCLLIWRSAKVLNRIDRKRLQIEADLRQSQEKLRLFAESDLIGFLFGDIYGGIHEVNDAFLKTIGYTREDVAAGRLRWDEITPSEYVSLDKERIAEARVRGLCTPYEKEYIRKDGRRVWVLVGYILLGEEREESVAFILDLSDRKQAETALHESEDRYRKLVEHSPDGIFIQSQNKFVFANQAALDFFGANSSEELLGQTVYDFICPENAEMVTERIQRLRDGRAVSLIEEKWFRLDGTVVDAEVAAIPFTYQGQSAAQVVIRDISDRKRDQIALEEKEALLSLAMEYSQAGVYDWLPQEDRVIWSPEYYNVFGLDPSYSPNYQTWLERVHPDDRDRVSAEITQALEQKTDLDLVYRISHPQGERWINGRGKASYNEAGEAVRFVGLCLDISDRKRAEDALKESEARFRQIVTTIDDVFWMSEPRKERLIYISYAYEKIWGRSCESVKANWREWINAIHPEDRQKVERRFFERIFEGNYDEEYRIVRPDDSIRWVRDRGYPILNEAGEPQYVSGIAQDITERKQIEIELHQTLAILKAINDNTPTLIYAKDLQSRLIRANPPVCQLLGKPVSEVIGFTDIDLYPNREDAERVIANDRLVIETGQVQVIEETSEFADGRRTYLSTKSPYRDENGEIVGIIGISTEISDRKQIEAELRQTLTILNAINENTPTFMFVKDLQGRVVLANPVVLQVLGKSASEVIGFTDLDFCINREDAERVMATDRSVMESGRVLVIEETIEFPEGVRTYLSTKSPYRDENGDIIGLIGISTDISDRKRAKEALAQSEERLRLATEAAEIGMWFWDLSSNELVWTDKCKALFGLPADTQMSYQQFLNSLHPDDRQSTHKAVIRALEEKVEYDVEYRSVWSDGSIHWIAAKGRGFYNAEGKAVKMMGTVQDISDRKKAEIERDRFFNLSLDMLCISGMDGYFKRLNPAFEQILGYTPAEILARPFLDFIHPEDRLKTIAEVEKLATGAITLSFENRYRCQDGSYKWLVWSAVPDIETHLMYGVAHDITGRKQLEMTLREQAEALQINQERLDLIIEAANIGLWYNPLPLGKLDWNDQCKGHFGLPPDAEIDIDLFYQLLHPDDRAPIEQAIAYAIENNTTFNVDYRTIAPDGQIRWIQAIGRTFCDATGKPTHFDGITMDVSDRKRIVAEMREFNTILEERVKQRTAQLEAANQELESFSYSVSHDLRAPLRHIAGFVELLQKQLMKTKLDPTSRRYLDIIVETTQQAGQLIDDLLTFSRMGRVEMRYTAIDMNMLVQEVISDFRLETYNREINLHIDELPTVQADPSMLRLVWQNLLENALKYTKLSPQTEISVESYSTSQEVIFFVKDNGIGFDMQYVHKLFGVFQRLHSDPQYDGTGVGLANVQRIIHRHGGRVWAEGVANEGATFYFALPKEIKVRGGEQ